MGTETHIYRDSGYMNVILAILGPVITMFKVLNTDNG
jgi:hypothetical protein